MKSTCFLLLVVFYLKRVLCQCDGNGTWMREASLDKNVTIKWSFSDDTFTMAMIGRTKGWIAVAFGASRSWNGSDVVIGWVDDKTNKTYLQDRYAKEKNQVLLDDKNSYTLLTGNQNESSTIICWKRKIDTCDNQDVPFTFSTFRVYWAIGQEDPPQENFQPNIASSMRMKNIRLLSPEYPKPDSPDIMTIDFVVQNLTVEKVETGTVYWCTHFTLEAGKKSHLVAFTPVIQTENAAILHHYLLYECPASLMKTVNKSLIPKEGYNCFDPTRFVFQDLCIKTLNVWAVEGSGVNFPNNIGFPFHSENEEKYYMLQSHYNVRNLKTSIKDNSGVRISYTYKLRPDEAGQVGIGVYVSPFHLIPPQQKSFTSVSLCTGNCTQLTIPEAGITALAVMFHTHSTGRRIRLRIIRDGKELEPIADENYDYEYYQQSFLPKPFELLPGDTFLTECDYDTSSRNYTTVGNFGTTDEMCLIFLLYLKPANFTWCYSYYQPDDVYNLTGIQEIYPLPEFCKGDDCPSIYAPQGLADLMATVKLPKDHDGQKLIEYFNKYQWNESSIQALKDMNQKDQVPLCKTNDKPIKSSLKDVAAYPINFIPYKKPDVCSGDSS